MFLKLLPTILLLMSASVFYSQAPPPDTIGPGVSHELAIWRAARYSDVRYKLNLTLEKMSPVLKGTIEIRMKVSDPRATATAFNPGAMGGTILPKKEVDDSGIPPIILDWRKIRGHEDASTISNVSINGTSMRVAGLVSPSNRDGYFEDFSEHLIFRNGVVAGENVIKLDFTSPILTSGSAITRYIDKEDGSEYLYSLFVPSDASTAFPVFDQPDLKARFALTISKPLDWRKDLQPQLDWKFVSNTAGKEWIENTNGSSGRQTYQTVDFAETKPISTYVFAFGAGPAKGCAKLLRFCPNCVRNCDFAK